MRTANKVLIAISVVAISLTIAANAFAKKPKPYQGTAGATQSAVQRGVSATSTSGGTLPFTGVDLGLFAAGGAALLVVGYSMSRAGRRRG